MFTKKNYMDIVELGKRLTILREQKGVSRYALGKKINQPTNRLRDIEATGSCMSDTLLAYLTAIGCTLQDVLDIRIGNVVPTVEVQATKRKIVIEDAE